jgi:hypothetical protein
MIDMDSFKGADGRYDWDAYHRAQVDAGEECRTCGHFIVWGKGYASQCSDCESIQTDDGEVSHDSRIRCPKCRDTSPIDDRYRLYEEGTHDVSCNECGHDYEVTTYVSRSFKSPKMIETAKD